MVAVGRGNVFGRLPGSSQLGCQKCHLVFHAGQRQLQLRVLVLEMWINDEQKDYQ